MVDDIRIGEEQPLTTRLSRAQVEGVDLAEPALRQDVIVNHTHVVMVRYQAVDDRARRIGRLVVDDDQLKGSV